MKTLLAFLFIMCFTSIALGEGEPRADIDGLLIDHYLKEKGLDKDSKDKKTKESGVKAEAKPEKKVLPEELQPVFKSEAKKETKKKATSNIWVRMLLSLLVVLGIIFAGAFFIKSWSGTKTLSQRARMIEVLSQHHMGGRRSVALIRVAGETVLIGLTDHNISMLKSLTLLEEDVPAEEVPKGQKKGKRFVNALAGTLDSALPKFNSSSSSDNKEDFALKNLKDIVGSKLKNMKEL